MRRLVDALRRGLWCAGICALLLASRATASDHALSADLDGDGRGDRITINAQEPTILHVWLSATQTTNIIRSRQPLLRVAVIDLDGDNRAELIASGSSTGLQVWTKRSKGFRTFRPRSSRSPSSLSRSSQHASDDGLPLAPETGDAFRPLPSLLVLPGHPGAPMFKSWRRAPRLARGPTPPPCFTPFAPRPPPLPAV
jgi:hypothetical protein